MLRRTLMSALLCALLSATHLVALTLYLNPELPRRAEWRALTLGLLLPYTLMAWPALLLVALVLAVLRFWPERVRRPVRALPWFTSLMLVTVVTSAVLYAH